MAESKTANQAGDKHPRDQDGKFTDKSASGAKSSGGQQSQSKGDDQSGGQKSR